MKLFGTDGIRDTANQGNLTPEIALKVGIACGSLFKRGDHRHRVIIGKDTRLSGYLIEPALTSGFIAAGMDVFLLGPMPTPAVAMLTKAMRADIGIMISASHNPYQDNGVKIFDPDGCKLSEKLEAEIEKRVFGDINKYLVKSSELGRAKRLDDAQGRYIEFVKNTFPRGKNLEGLKVVIDCANGAAYNIGATILWELGAEVIAIGVNPDGCNINDQCGAMYPDRLVRKVLETKADIGIALDGDADRVVIVDETGRIIGGDQLMAVIAKYWHDIGRLKNDTVIVTHMSNIALDHYLQDYGISVKRTNIGDKHVAEMMRVEDCNFGGEQSGHIIFSDYTTTGDGIVAGLQILSIMVENKQKASNVCNVFEPYPQLLKNISFIDKSPLENVDVQDNIQKITNEFQDECRILVRKSGTENLIRVMVEGRDTMKINNVCDQVLKAINIVGTL
jgi:phosphoglucosamine mutase